MARKVRESWPPPPPPTTDQIRAIGKIVEDARATLFPYVAPVAPDDGKGPSVHEAYVSLMALSGQKPSWEHEDRILGAMLDALVVYGWPLIDRLRAPEEREWLLTILYSVRAADEIDGERVRTKRSFLEGSKYAEHRDTWAISENHTLGWAIVRMMVKAGARPDLDAVDPRDKRWLRAIHNVDRTLPKRVLKTEQQLDAAKR